MISLRFLSAWPLPKESQPFVTLKDLKDNRGKSSQICEGTDYIPVGTGGLWLERPT